MHNVSFYCTIEFQCVPSSLCLFARGDTCLFVSTGSSSGRVPVPGGGVHAPLVPALRGEQLQRGHHAGDGDARAAAQAEEAQDVARAAPAHRAAAHGDGLPEEELRVRPQVALGHHGHRLWNARYWSTPGKPVRPQVAGCVDWLGWALDLIT